MPISELTDHIERLKANDNLKFSQEYEVRLHFSSFLVNRIKGRSHTVSNNQKMLVEIGEKG